jgi:hypothetical protein
VVKAADEPLEAAPSKYERQIRIHEKVMRYPRRDFGDCGQPRLGPPWIPEMVIPEIVL